MPEQGTGTLAQPGARSRLVLAVVWLLLGCAMVGVAVWLALTRLGAILNGHPAMLVGLVGCGVAGLLAVAWSVATLVVGDRQDREGDPDHPAHRTAAQLRRRARWRIVLALPALLVCLVLVSLLAYARPAVATDVALTALRSVDGVKVVQRLTWYEMIPDEADAAGQVARPTTGLVLSPGARVDARAYAHLVRPLVEAGYFVAVLKEPFGLALLDRDHAQTVIGLHPEIRYWAVGGHSLGGVAAAAVADADPRVGGLVLWASYPAVTLQRGDLKVLSVSGSADGLAPPAQIAANRGKLPASTTYVVIEGAVHSYFGDYGEQDGDGRPTASRPVAQAEISAATAVLLASLAPPPKKKKK